MAKKQPKTKRKVKGKAKRKAKVMKAFNVLTIHENVTASLNALSAMIDNHLASDPHLSNFEYGRLHLKQKGTQILAAGMCKDGHGNWITC